MYDYAADERDDAPDLPREELWTVEEVAARWRVQARTVRDMISKGELHAFKIRTIWRVYLSEVLRYEQRSEIGKTLDDFIQPGKAIITRIT